MNKYNIKSSKQKQAIIKHLIELGKGKIAPDCADCGICSDLKWTFDHIINSYKLVQDLSVNWCDYSGSNLHPVPYHLATEVDIEQWEDTPYGDARRELCLHLATELKKLKLSYKSEVITDGT